MESQSFTEKEALDLKLIDLVVKDVPELLAKLDGREVKRFDGTTSCAWLKGEKTVAVAMNWRAGDACRRSPAPRCCSCCCWAPWPGSGPRSAIPACSSRGSSASFCLILFLFASQIIPVNWAGVLLIVLAIGLFAAEVKVPSYGLLTVAGHHRHDPRGDDARGRRRSPSCA